MVFREGMEVEETRLWLAGTECEDGLFYLYVVLGLGAVGLGAKVNQSSSARAPIS
jgi:hypothetical protein